MTHFEWVASFLLALLVRGAHRLQDGPTARHTSPAIRSRPVTSSHRRSGRASPCSRPRTCSTSDERPLASTSKCSHDRPVSAQNFVIPDSIPRPAALHAFQAAVPLATRARSVRGRPATSSALPRTNAETSTCCLITWLTPAWGEHWGNDWEQKRGSWNQVDRSHIPPATCCPSRLPARLSGKCRGCARTLPAVLGGRRWCCRADLLQYADLLDGDSRQPHTKHPTTRWPV